MITPTFLELPDGPSVRTYSGYGGQYIKVNATQDGLEFGTPTGGGVTGPATTTNNALARWDGATGAAVQDSAVVCDDSGNVSGMTTLSLPNTGLRLKDTDGSHSLIIKPGSNLTANRTLTVTTGNADRTLQLGGNLQTAGQIITSGAYGVNFTFLAATSVTFPTSGVLTTTANKLSDFAVPDDDLDCNGFKITNLGTPTAAGDAVNKSYADAIASGLSTKALCRVGTTAALNTTYAGTPNFTLTCNVNGAISIDGISLILNDRVLVKDQAVATENGIYYVTQVGTAGTPYILTRATDYDTSAEIGSGDYTFVTEGTINAAHGFCLITADPITLDASNLVWTTFITATNYSAGNGIDITGLSVAVKLAGSSGLSVSGSGLTVDFTAVQAYDAGLASIASMVGLGILCQTAADTFEPRALGASTGLSITNPDATGGNPTVDLDINSLTEDVAPTVADDYLLEYSASAGAHRKVKIENALVGGRQPRNVGTSPLEIWYSAAVNNYSCTTNAFAGATSGADTTIYAVPFYYGAEYTIDRIGIRVTTAVANTVARLGIYKATSRTNIYPDTLLVESSELDCSTTGAKTATVAATLAAGTMYWLAYQCYNNAATATYPTVRALSNVALPQVLGCSSALGASSAINAYLSVASAYGAYPATFPAGGALVATNVAPAVYVRLSA